MKPIKLILAPLLERFFMEWLINQKKVSPNTITAYKNTFQFLLQYAEKHLKKKSSQLLLTDLHADFICNFLTYLIESRKVCAKTRNARLAAIKSFFHYVAIQEPEKSEFIGRILAIPESKVIRRQIHFLTPEELDSLLDTADLETWVGRRDYAMILVAAETGLRLAELISLTWNDVCISGRGSGYIQCTGKGRKERSSPLSHPIAKLLRNLKDEMTTTSSAFVFPSNKGSKMSQNCFQKQLERRSKLAAESCKTLLNKKVTPHMLRHTAAMNFLQAGVDLSTIAMILGHKSVETTQIYLEADLQLKEKALKKLTPKKIKSKHFKIDDKLLKFLKSL